VWRVVAEALPPDGAASSHTPARPAD
jgi:hypothetical protein